jgi:hypothetical protein
MQGWASIPGIFGASGRAPSHPDRPLLPPGAAHRPHGVGDARSAPVVGRVPWSKEAAEIVSEAAVEAGAEGWFVREHRASRAPSMRQSPRSSSLAWPRSSLPMQPIRKTLSCNKVSKAETSHRKQRFPMDACDLDRNAQENSTEPAPLRRPHGLDDGQEGGTAGSLPLT